MKTSSIFQSIYDDLDTKSLQIVKILNQYPKGIWFNKLLKEILMARATLVIKLDELEKAGVIEREWFGRRIGKKWKRIIKLVPLIQETQREVANIITVFSREIKKMDSKAKKITDISAREEYLFSRSAKILHWLFYHIGIIQLENRIYIQGKKARNLAIIPYIELSLGLMNRLNQIIMKHLGEDRILKFYRQQNREYLKDLLV